MPASRGFIVGVDTQVKNKKVYMLMLANFDSKNNKWTGYRFGRISEDKLYHRIKCGEFSLYNADVDGQKIVGTTGSLSRFEPKTSIGISPLIIMSELRSDDASDRLLGYRVANKDGKILRIKLSDVLKQCIKVTDKAKN